MSPVPLARILVVDDEAALMRALCDTLRNHGYDTTGFTTGEDALKALGEKPYDLLLTDLMMPGMDGVALLREALKIDPQMVGILMTGMGTIETAVQAMQAGALDYILKPFKMGAILPVLARALTVRRLRLENLELRNTIGIHELNQALAYTLDPNVLLDKIADAALQQFEADEASIMLLDPDGRSFHVAAVRGERRDALLGTRVAVGGGIAGWVAARKEPLMLQGEVDDSRIAPLHPRAEIQSALSMPMMARDRLVGVINVNCIRKRRTFTLGAVRALGIFTNAAATGIVAAQLHEQLRESERRLSFALRKSRTGGWEIDLADHSARRTAEHDRIFGYDTPLPDWGYRSFLDHVLPEDRPEVDRSFREATAAREEWRFECRIRRSDGQVRWIWGASEPQLEEGETRRMAGIIQDITERKLAEEKIRRINEDLEERVRERTAELETATRAKDTFLATMSHEIRTPMNGVLGMLELMELSRLGPEQRATLGIVRESGRSLLRIIDDILDFSKIEAGKLEVRPEATSVADVVERVVRIYSVNAASKGLALRHSVDDRISPALWLDPVRLQQILNNFVSNAIKFTAKGHVEIAAQLVGHRGGKELLRFSVRDTGIGISAEDQARLFQPFAQVEGAARSRLGGTGLGLSICSRLAQMMRGTVTMTSEPGVGTTLALELPAAIADAAALPKAEAAREGAGRVGARRAAPTAARAEQERTLILVVDDHPINCMVLLRQVNALGYAAEKADNGVSALEKLLTGRFSLLITDCHMPEMDGYDLARNLRSHESRAGRVRTPIIACTANAMSGEAEACFEAGMDDYIAKPVALKDLMSKLDRWLPLDRSPAAPAVTGSTPGPAT